MKRFAFILLAALAVVAVIGWDSDSSTRCRFCGNSSYGHGCPYSPSGRHQHRGVTEACEYCGNSSYGFACSYSPVRTHKHGSDGAKCIWCGSSSYGHGCPYSPDSKHEH